MGGHGRGSHHTWALAGLLALLLTAESCRDSDALRAFLADCPQASAKAEHRGLEWAARKDMCQWKGVVCAGKADSACRVVKEISFSAMGPGTQPCKIDELGKLTNLTKLNAFGIDASTWKLDSMSSNWAHMETLHLENNMKVKGIFPEFRGNHRLKKLNLKNTGLGGTLPAWEGLRDIEQLDLDNTVITGPCPRFDTYMFEHLQIMHISGPNVHLDPPLPKWDEGFFKRRDTEVDIVIMGEPAKQTASVVPEGEGFPDPEGDGSGEWGIVIFLAFFLFVALAISYFCLSAMYTSMAFKTFLYTHLPGVRRTRRHETDADSVGSDDDEMDLVDPPGSATYPTDGQDEEDGQCVLEDHGE